MADRRNTPGWGPKPPHELMPEVAADRPDAELAAAIDKVVDAAVAYSGLLRSRVGPGDATLRGCQLAAGAFLNAAHAVTTWKDGGDPRPLVEFGVAINALEATRAGFASAGDDHVSPPTGDETLPNTVASTTNIAEVAGQWVTMLSLLERDNEERTPEAATLIERYEEFAEKFVEDAKTLAGGEFTPGDDCKGLKAVVVMSSVVRVLAIAVEALTKKNDASVLLALLNMNHSVAAMIKAIGHDAGESETNE